MGFMLGQRELLGRIDNLIESDKLPKFIILVGQRGSGKELIINHIHEELESSVIIYMGISVNDVRQAVTQTQTLKGKTVVCVFKHADSMSLAAKNALLKIVEEPPKNVYFIMTLQSIGNTLDTIKSRATVFNMQPYTPMEIGEYAKKYNLTTDELGVVTNICETPGDVEVLYNDGIIAFDEYVTTVVEYIAEVSGANCFSIGKKIRFKDDTDGYDLLLFYRAFISKCMERINDDVSKYAEAIRITTKRMQELTVNGINKQNSFDMWILDIRKAWFD